MPYLLRLFGMGSGFPPHMKIAPVCVGGQFHADTVMRCATIEARFEVTPNFRQNF